MLTYRQAQGFEGKIKCRECRRQIILITHLNVGVTQGLSHFVLLFKKRKGDDDDIKIDPD